MCGIKYGVGVCTQSLEPLGVGGVAFVEYVTDGSAGQFLGCDDSALSTEYGEHMLHDCGGVANDIVRTIGKVESVHFANGPAVGECALASAAPSAKCSALTCTGYRTGHITVGDVDVGRITHIHSVES